MTTTTLLLAIGLILASTGFSIYYALQCVAERQKSWRLESRLQETLRAETELTARLEQKDQYIRYATESFDTDLEERQLRISQLEAEVNSLKLHNAAYKEALRSHGDDPRV